MELGGNDAAILLPGADPAIVAPGVFNGAFMNAGQVCLAIKRAYIHESIYDEVVAGLAALADATVVDNGLHQGAMMGPLQNRMQYEKVKGFLETARADGRIVAGGEAVDKPGFFIRPTIVVDIDDRSRLVQEEQFGPVLPVVKYANPEEALQNANASPWGLGGSVWVPDREKSHDIALQMQTGTTWINKHLDFSPVVPFGGLSNLALAWSWAKKDLWNSRRFISLMKPADTL